MPYGVKPPEKKTPNPPNFKPRPPRATPSKSKPPRPKPAGAAKPPRPPRQRPPKRSEPKLNNQDFSNIMTMKETPSAGGSTSTTKKVKSFMKKYGQA